MATRGLRSYFSLKSKEHNKEAQNLEVSSTSDLVKSWEHFILTDTEAVNKELNGATSV